MAWIPSYKITGGLLAGLQSPKGGSLQGLWDFPSASHQFVGNIAYSSRDSFSNDDWSGAFGTSCANELMNYGIACIESGSGLNTWFLLAQFDVPNPEGAQYYKQAYVVEAYMTARYQENRYTYQDFEYYCKWAEFNCQYRVSRFQWDTPYSSYTRTDMGYTRSLMIGCKIVDENISDAAYYAYRGGAIVDRVLLALGTFTANGIDYFGVGAFNTNVLIPTRIVPSPNPNNRRYMNLIGQKIDWLNTLYGGNFEPEGKDDPNDEDPPEDGPGQGGGGGGEGDHVLPDGPVLIPPIPGLGSCSPSWLRTYMMDKQDIDEFGQELVDPTPMQQLKAYFADPLDAIVGITLCPCIPEGPRYAYTPQIHGTPGYEFSRSFTAISSQFGIVDCGFVDMAPYWDNCFDFDPYTKISIFLPFIGFREINADEVMGGKIGVVYHVDVVTGDCVAFITISAPSGSIYGPMQEKVIGEHHGNCGVQVPIGRVSHDAAVGASLNLMTTFAGMAVGAAAGYAGLAAPQEISESQVASQLSSSTMTAVEGMKTKVERAGALGGNAGYMGNRKPYLIRQIPRQSKPSNYKQICGYPCNKEGPLSRFETGTLACVEDIQLNNIPAMETEREEIIQFLRGGVIL